MDKIKQRIEEDLETTAKINDYANRSLRDIADQDYIAARICYKAQLWEPFLWLSLQSFEKYLKAILLYNRISSKNLGHDLDKALHKIDNNIEIGFSVPEDVRQFMSYITNYGSNRYFEHSFGIDGEVLHKFDRSIWYIRRYCFYMDWCREKFDGTKVYYLKSNIQKVNNKENESKPHKYKIIGGLLERIIDSKNNQYQYLVWNNFYFGRQKKNRIRNFKPFTLLMNSTLVRHPDAYKLLEKYIQFSKETKEYFCSK